MKSQTCTKQFDDHAELFASSKSHARMFYVWHSGVVERELALDITLCGLKFIASKVFDASVLS